MKKKIGLALGSGGALGLSHIGVIKILKRYNVKIDYISGTSFGAFIAAYYSLFEEIDSLEKKMLSFKKRDLIGFVDFQDPRKSIIRGKKINKFLKEIFKNKKFSDTKIPLTIGATNLNDGSKVIFRKGKLINAIMCSAAFPGLFQPIKYKGRLLADGGIADPTPVNRVKEMGADIIIAVDLYSLKDTKFKGRGSIKVIGRVYDIIMSKMLENDIKSYDKNVIVLRPSLRKHIETFNFLDRKKFIVAGEKEGKAKISKILRMIK